MLPRYAACAGSRLCSHPVTLLLFALMLAVSASTLPADPNDLPRRVQGGVDSAAEVSVENFDGVVDTSFSVSMRDIVGLISRLPEGKVDAGEFKVDPSEKGDAARLVLPAPEAPPRFDLWAEGRHRQNVSGADLDPPGTLLVAADYEISPVLTVGALAGLNQFETANENDGDVWSGGPYARFQLIPNLFLTGLATWHRPDTIHEEAEFKPVAGPAGFRVIDQLRGEWSYGAWRVTPSVGYQLDNTAQSTDGTAAHTLSFGPAIGYHHARSNGTVVEPHLAVKGRWELAPLIGLKSHAYPPSWNGLDAKFEGGVRVQDFNGWSLDASTSVSGVNDPQGTIDWRGHVEVKVPLN